MANDLKSSPVKEIVINDAGDLNYNLNFPLGEFLSTRLEEKKELSELNHRLENYFKSVRKLEQANSNLSIECKAIKERSSKEMEEMMKFHEKELEEKVNIIDELNKENQNFNIKIKKNKKNQLLESALDDLRSNYNTASVGKKRAEQQLIETELINEKLQEELAEVQRRLDKEVNGKIELQGIFDMQKEQLVKVRSQLKEEGEKAEELDDRCNNLQDAVDYKEESIREMERVIKEEREWNKETLRKKDNEIVKLKEVLEQQARDMQQVFDDRWSIFFEINKLRQMLDEEDNRCKWNGTWDLCSKILNDH